MGQLRPVRIGRLPRPSRGESRDPVKTNAVRIKQLSKQPQPRTERPPYPDGPTTAYASKLVKIAREAYRIAEETVIAAILEQQRLAEAYQAAHADTAEEERAAKQNKPHTPEEKEELDEPDPVRKSWDKMERRMRLYSKSIKAFKLANQAATATEKFTNATQLQQLRNLGLNPIPLGSQLEQTRDMWVQDNVDLIVSQPKVMADRIGGIIHEMVPAGSRWETIADRLKDEYGIAERRAKLIARDQVQKYNSDLTRLQQRAAGFDYYQWRGAMDNRERPSHVALEGTVWSWDNPPIIGNPGEAIQCRCVAIPVYSEALIKQAETPQTLGVEQLIERTAELGPTQKQAPSLKGLPEDEQQKLIRERAAREIRGEIKLANRRETISRT